MTLQHNLRPIINKRAMKNCINKYVPSINLRLDLGFKYTQVQKYQHVE